MPNWLCNYETMFLKMKDSSARYLSRGTFYSWGKKKSSSNPCWTNYVTTTLSLNDRKDSSRVFQSEGRGGSNGRLFEWKRENRNITLVIAIIIKGSSCGRSVKACDLGNFSTFPESETDKRFGTNLFNVFLWSEVMSHSNIWFRLQDQIAYPWSSRNWANPNK